MAVGKCGGSGIDQLLSTAGALGSTTLDLNRKNLTEIPPGVLDLQQLEFLYLEGNYITFLPDTLFELLPNLKWLDLRNNHITEVSTAIGAHRCLKNLLLEGNDIRFLPLELGFAKSLSGLNLTSNPLDFPPAHIIERGTQEVLKFLREQHALRMQSNAQHGASVRPVSPTSSEDELACNRDFQSKEYADTPRRHSTGARISTRNGKAHDPAEPDIRPSHTPVSLHTPSSRPDLIRMQYDRQRSLLNSAGTAESVGKDSTGSARRLSRPMMQMKPIPRLERLRYDANSSPRFPDYEAKIAEQQQMAISTVLNEKENSILQKRKDKKALDDWRDKTRRIRQQKQHLASYKAPVPVDVNAPYGTENNMKEEKPNAMYVAKLKELLDEKDKGAARRALLDRELEERIRMHMEKIQDHRRKTYDDITDELESARRNLEMAHQFQRELDERRALEYRLRAFTGEDVALARGSTQKSSAKKQK